jgi:hypothetical protein
MIMHMEDMKTIIKNMKSIKLMMDTAMVVLIMITIVEVIMKIIMKIIKIPMKKIMKIPMKIVMKMSMDIIMKMSMDIAIGSIHTKRLTILIMIIRSMLKEIIMEK